MELILWRHAEAEQASDDLVRELTRRGQHQATDMAQWLRPRLPEKVRVLCSEARRSQQTATRLTKHFEIHALLNPLSEAREVLAWLQAEAAKGEELLVVVGHQPWLGQLASTLLAGTQADWSVKKGAVWWMSDRERNGSEQTVLKLMLTPGMLHERD